MSGNDGLLIVAMLIVAATIIVGALTGSFLDLVVWSTPRGESVRGNRRQCRRPISARYPLIEFTTAIAFGLVTWLFWAPIAAALTAPALIAALLTLVAFLYLAAISIVLTLIDLELHRLPNVIVLPAYAVGAVLLGVSSALIADWSALARAATGAAAMFGFFFLAAVIGPGGMGFGDVKLAGVLGLFLAWLGWGQLAVGALAAFILGGLFSVVLVALRRAGRRTRIPFGPWMLAGAWIGIAAGPPIWAAYLALFGLAS